MFYFLLVYIIFIFLFYFMFFFFFFFKQRTAYEMRISDWSSDVCSSDLPPRFGHETILERPDPLHRTHAEAPDSGGGLARNAIETSEAIGRRGDHEGVEAAPALVAVEQLGVA